MKETLEEAVKKYCIKKYSIYKSNDEHTNDFLEGYKLAQEQDKKMYSEEEVIAFVKWMYDYKADINKVEELFEQFKK
jgi:hypothetical protein